MESREGSKRFSKFNTGCIKLQNAWIGDKNLFSVDSQKLLSKEEETKGISKTGVGWSRKENCVKNYTTITFHIIKQNVVCFYVRAFFGARRAKLPQVPLFIVSLP